MEIDVEREANSIAEEIIGRKLTGDEMEKIDLSDIMYAVQDELHIQIAEVFISQLFEEEMAKYGA